MNQHAPACINPGATGYASACNRTVTNHRQNQWHSKTAKDGFSLLEVILSLAILAGSLAALGEVMRQADRNASLSSDEARGQMIAASIMDELIAGARQLTATSKTRYDLEVNPPWLFSISLENTSYTELVGVRIQVEQELEAQQQPAKYELVRWLLSPDYIAQAQADAEAEQNANASSSSSSSSSTSSGSSQGGSSSGSSSSGGGP